MPDPLMLAIETSNPHPPASSISPAAPRPGIAVARITAPSAFTTLGVEPIDTARTQEDDLLPAIHRLFTRLNLAPRDLRAVAVSIGPGGFTAVRLAVTAAKMISEATGAHCLPVPTPNIVARRINPTAISNGHPFAVALASKNDSAFISVFNSPESSRAPGSVLEAADLAALDIDLLAADQFFPQSMRDRCRDLSIQVVEPIFDPIACLEAALNIQPVDPVALLPFYPREPEAVTKWRKLHPPA